MGWLSAGIPDNEIENSNARLTTPTEKKAGAFSGAVSAVSAVPKGIGAGLGKVVETISDSPLSKPLDFLGYGVTGAADLITDGSSDTFEQYREKQAANRETNLKATYDYLSPTVDDGIVSNVLYGLSDYLTRAAVGGAVGGIGGAAALTGASDYNFVTNDLVRKGVDLNDARVAGAVQGATSAVLTATPLSFVRGGASVGRQAADAVVAIGAPVILDSAGRAYNQNRLADKGYTDQAKQFEVTPETVITGLVLGGVMHAGARYVKNKQATATNAADLAAQAETGVVPDDGVVSVTPDDVNATQARNDQVNNMLAINQILFNEDASSPIHAPTPFQINHHLQNMRTATDQLLNGQPVNVPNNLQGVPKINLPGQASALAAQASASGVNPNTALLISHIETGGTFNPKAQNPNSSANGLFQVIDSSWKRLGGGDRSNVSEQIRVGLAHMKEVAGVLRNTLKREPQVHEEYMGHLLGAGGASKVLTADPNARLYDVVYAYTKVKTAAQRAKTAQDVVNNNGMKGLTVGQAITKWQNKAAAVQAKIGGVADDVPVRTNAADDSIAPTARPEEVAPLLDEATVRSNNLKDWYGRDDEPPIYYHGTNRDWNAWDSEQGGGLINLTDRIDIAQRYAEGAGGGRGKGSGMVIDQADNVYKVQDDGNYINQTTKEVVELSTVQAKLEDGEFNDYTPAGNVKALYTNIKNPLDLTTPEGIKALSEIAPKTARGQAVVDAAKNGDFNWQSTKNEHNYKHWRDDLIPSLKEKGFDGLYFHDDMHKTLAAFDAKQIKSADKNTGGFNRDSPDIYDTGYTPPVRAPEPTPSNNGVDAAVSAPKPVDDPVSTPADTTQNGTGISDIPEVMAANQALDTMGDMQIAITRENANGEIETITMSARERMAELEGEMKQADEIGVAATAAATCALQFGA